MRIAIFGEHMFTRYAAIVKNLRGVLLFDLKEEGVKDKLEWLVKRFKYRNLGVTPTLLSKYYEDLKKHLNGKPFRKLVYPISELEKATEIVSKALNVPLIVSEALTFSSIYISPLLMIGSSFKSYIEENSIEIVRTCKEMDIKSWKLHLRIADYTILDMYEENVCEALRIISGLKSKSMKLSELEEILRNRVARVQRDVKRYWRIKCDEGRPFLYYVDLLSKVIDKIARGELDADKLIEEYSASLTIIPVVYVPAKHN